jgi:SAM-dependent methyltransferase
VVSVDYIEYNRKAWNHQVAIRNRWTVPVTPKQIEDARLGNWSVLLTPAKPVPMSWFPANGGRMDGVRILNLASGGGQQTPIFAAAGALVTVHDLSESQLEQDRRTARSAGLDIRTECGDMRDLSRYPDESFDFIFHPCSNTFVADIQPVWEEAFRVLKSGGEMIAGFVNPVLYSVDPDLDAKGIARLKYAIPYSDLTSLTDEERRRYTDKNEPLCFGHTLEQQIGGQLRAGFRLVDLYEDRWGEDAEATGALNALIPCFLATRAIKPIPSTNL